jgi:hypothetical protein
LAGVSLLVLATAATPVLARNQASSSGEPDPILGTWTLDIEKSKYVPGPKPKSQTRTYTLHPDGIKTHISTVEADGVPREIEFVAKYDSIQYPVSGSAEVDSVALRRIDAFTAEAVLTHAGRRMATARRVIAPDGKTMTISLVDASGVPTTVAVYRKKE